MSSRHLATLIEIGSAIIPLAVIAASQAIATPPVPVLVESAAPETSRSSTLAEPSDPSVPRQEAAKPQSSEEPQGQQLPDGVWSHGDGTGRALARGKYQDGRRQGLWVRYFEPGEGEMFAATFYRDFEPPFTSEAEFKDGVLEGAWTVYDSKKRIATRWEFHDNVAHGKSTWFFADGATRQESSIRQGRLDGDHTVWDEQHQIVESLQFADGLRLTPYQEFYSPKQVRCTGSYVDTAERKEVSFNWWQGVAGIVSIRGEAGQAKHGLWTWSYESGQKLLEGSYHEGHPTGSFTWWYENGQRQLAGSYVNGEPNGPFIWWHENGQKELSAPYVAGRQSGPWMLWDSEGAVLEKGAMEIDPLSEFLAGGKATTNPRQLPTVKAPLVKNKLGDGRRPESRLLLSSPAKSTSMSRLKSSQAPTLAEPIEELSQPLGNSARISTSSARAKR